MTSGSYIKVYIICIKSNFALRGPFLRIIRLVPNARLAASVNSFTHLSNFHSLDILHLRVQLAHELHALLVHGKDNTTAHDQPRQPRQSTAPKGQDTLLLKDHACALERVSVHLTRLDTLHSRLDGVERLGHIDGNETCETTHGKSSDGTEFLAGRGVGFGELLEESVGAESGGRVGGLASCRGDETLEEAAETAFASDDGDGVEEAAKSRLG